MNPVRLEKSARFVIQKHTRPEDIHWDLMLESNGCLVTWRVDAGPEKLADNVASAVRIADHELRFLTYQGSVNKGEGSVEIAAKGTYILIDSNDNTITTQLKSKEISGKFHLTIINENIWEFAPTI